MELKYLSILKKLLKKIRHKLDKNSRRELSLLFLSLSKNYTYTKKSKNSRMGKGKGSVTRLLVRVPKFKPFIYFSGHYPASIAKVANSFYFKTRIRLGLSLSYNSRLFYGLGSGKHPYQTFISKKLV